jgi:hypothetical protein
MSCNATLHGEERGEFTVSNFRFSGAGFFSQEIYYSFSKNKNIFFRKRNFFKEKTTKKSFFCHREMIVGMQFTQFLRLFFIY